MAKTPNLPRINSFDGVDMSLEGDLSPMPGAEDPIPTANSKPNPPGQTLTDEHFLSPSTTHSFPPPFAIQASKAAATQRTIHSVGPLVLLLVAAGQLVNQSRPLLVQRICGSQTQAAAKMATFASLGGLSEFILNPLMGRLSDRFGRRPILMSCAVLRKFSTKSLHHSEHIHSMSLYAVEHASPEAMCTLLCVTGSGVCSERSAGAGVRVSPYSAVYSR